MGNPKEKRGVHTCTHICKENPKLDFGKGRLLWHKEKYTNNWMPKECHIHFFHSPYQQCTRFYLPLNWGLGAHIWYSLIQVWARLWQTAFLCYLHCFCTCMCVQGTSHRFLSWEVWGAGSLTEQIEHSLQDMKSLVFLLNGPQIHGKLRVYWWSAGPNICPGHHHRQSWEKLCVFCGSEEAGPPSAEWSEKEVTSTSQSRALALSLAHVT